MIKSIRLLNWRSHADTSLEFRKGTNLLVGIMGAGKSSILEGISFALFGTFPALERRKLKQDDIVRLNEQEAKAILEFEWEGTGYRIERVIERSKKGTSSHAEIFREGALVENGPVAVNSYVRNLTGVDYDLFTRAIYSEQNNIDYFLNLDPRRRREEIDALLGLDKFEEARSNIVTVIHRMRTRKQAIEERFSPARMSELEAKEKEKAGESGALISSLAKAAEAFQARSKESAGLESRFVAMRRIKEESDRLSKEEIRLSAQHEAMRKELEGKTAEPDAVGKMEKRLAEAVSERSKLSVAARTLDERLAGLMKEGASIDARMKAASEAGAEMQRMGLELSAALGPKGAEGLSEAQKKAEQELLSMESERKSLEREIAEVSSSLERLKPGLSECPLCFSSLTDDGIAHVKKEKAGLISMKKGRIAELAASMPQKKKENEALLARLRRASVLSERMKSMETELSAAESLRPRRKSIESELASLSEERRTMQIMLDSVLSGHEKLKMEHDSLKGLVRKLAEAAAVAGRLESARSSLSRISFDEKAFEALRTEAEGSRLQLERLQAEKKSLEAQLKMTEDMLRMVREELSAMKKMRDSLALLSGMEEQLSIYKNALLDTQTSLRSRLADAINTAMNEVWPLFYPYRNYQALRLGVSEKDYVFEVDGGNGWRSLETVASGGERACAALALRVALAMVLTPKLSWLILDEPTHNLDSEAVEMLSGALQFKVPEVVKQTFVITHDEAFMGSDFASSYRLSRDKEHDGETKVDAA